MTQLYIVRHGETRENLARILQGHLPGELTELGRQQVHDAAVRLAGMGVKFDEIVCSDLKRTVDSAAIINEQLHLPVTPMRVLRERDWGECTTMPIAEARELYYRDGKWHFPPSAESEDDIYRRAGEALEQLREQYPGKTLIVVTHGQFARNLIASQFACPLAEVTLMINGEIRPLEI